VRGGGPQPQHDVYSYTIRYSKHREQYNYRLPIVTASTVLCPCTLHAVNWSAAGTQLTQQSITCRMSAFNHDCMFVQTETAECALIFTMNHKHCCMLLLRATVHIIYHIQSEIVSTCMSSTHSSTHLSSPSGTRTLYVAYVSK